MNLQLFLSKFKAKYAYEQNQLSLANYLREELQLLILEAIFTTNLPLKIYFMGGTCLHFCAQLPRFSEDLDFSLLKPDSLNLEEYKRTLWQKLNPSLTGIPLILSTKDTGNVKKIIFKFPELLEKLGISPMVNTNVQINWECDINPPLGAGNKLTLAQSLFSAFYINHFDLETCFAGKISAILTRKYTKGRDYFDLLWLLQQTPSILPNQPYLQARLAQEKIFGESRRKTAWPEIKYRLQQKIENLDLTILKKDLTSLVPITAEHLMTYIGNYQALTLSLLEQLSAHEI